MDTLRSLVSERKYAMACFDGYVDTKRYGARRLDVNARKFTDNHKKVLVKAVITGAVVATTIAALSTSAIRGSIALDKRKTIAKAAATVREFESESYSTELQCYNIVVSKTAQFIKKLNPSNALETCNFINIMLKNGLFSYNHTFCYSENLVEVYTFKGMTVATGKGVCRTEGYFLCDVLKAMGYDAYPIYNSIYKTEEEKASISKSPNHLFVLIHEGDKYFIYDITNDLFFDIEGFNYAEANDGQIKSDLNMYVSWLKSNVDTKTVFKLLVNSLVNADEYDEEEIRESADNALTKLLVNTNADTFNEFYNEISPYLQIINDGLNEKYGHLDYPIEINLSEEKGNQR